MTIFRRITQIGKIPLSLHFFSFTRGSDYHQRVVAPGVESKSAKIVKIRWSLDSIAIVVSLVATLLGVFSLYGQEVQAITATNLPLQQSYPPPPTLTPTPTPTPTFLQVFSIAPATADRANDTTVQIDGAGFGNAPALRLGSYALVDVRRLSSERLTAVIPAGLPIGIYDLFITNPDGRTVLLAQGFTVTTDGLAIGRVQPTQGLAGVETMIYIEGFSFVNGASVQLASAQVGDIYLDTFYLGNTLLRAVVPETLTAGIYDLTVVNPNGSGATTQAAYTVLSDDGINDDLYATSGQLWSEPAALRAGAMGQVGLLVTRQGGKTPLQDVKVRFYVGDPNAGGEFLGESTVFLLAPRSSESTGRVDWTPSAPGSYTLFASIDPDNSVAESLESNNLASRTLTVLPQASDQLAPRVDSFTIDNGDSTTTDLTVQLDVSASDPTPGSGLKSVLYQEFEFSPGANQWITVRNSGWLDYATTHVSYVWEMIPSPGVKYLHAWAADFTGNISIRPFRASINYVPPTDRVRVDQSRTYRYLLEPGDRVAVILTPISGDPDLYIWPPNPNAPPYVSNLSGTTVDSYTFSPNANDFAADGNREFQIEVYGYSAAEYRLSVEINAAVRAFGGISGGTDPVKPQLTQPSLSRTSTPTDRQGLQTAPTLPEVPPLQLFLPTIAR